MPEALRELSGAWNFRDVADGAPMLRPGRLFRSGELSGLDDEGRATLRRLGVHLLPFPDLGEHEAGTDDQAPHEHAFQRLLTGDGGRAVGGVRRRGRHPLHDRRIPAIPNA